MKRRALLQMMRDILYKDYYKSSNGVRGDSDIYYRADYILESHNFTSGINELVDNDYTDLIANYSIQRHKLKIDKKYRLPFTGDNYLKPAKTRSEQGTDQQSRQDTFWFHLNLIILFLIFVIAGILFIFAFLIPSYTRVLDDIKEFFMAVILGCPFFTYDFIGHLEERIWNPKCFQYRKELNQQLEKYID